MSNFLVARLRFITELSGAEQIALEDDRRKISYLELITRVESLAQQLSQIEVTTVAFRCRNSIEWVLLDLACQAANLICIPLPDFFTLEQCHHCLLTSGADLFLSDENGLTPEQLNQNEHCFSATPQALHNLEGIAAWKLKSQATSRVLLPPNTQKITFTSGSTGTPKGVCLSLEHQWRVAESLADAIAIAKPNHFCFLPLATLLENIGGIYTTLLLGGKVMLRSDEQRGLSGSSGLDVPRFLACLAKLQPSSIIMIPQILRVLLLACAQGWVPPSTLRFMAVGGGKVDPQLIGQAHQFGLPVYEGYGLSECASVVALNTPWHQKSGSVGRVLPHCQVEIIDGEIWVTGSAFLGYLDEPDSWHLTSIATGDLGQLDNDGFLSIRGRCKNILITAFGRNINPEWLESRLQSNAAITQCVVSGDGRPAPIAVLSAIENLTDKEIDAHVARINQSLPDYARLAGWIRLSIEQWKPLLTANGRPKRAIIERQLQPQFDALYQQLSITT